MRTWVFLLLFLFSHASAARINGLEVQRRLLDQIGNLSAFVALGSGEVIVQESGNRFTQRNPVSGKVIRQYDFETKVSALSLSSKGSLLLLATDTRVEAFDWRTGRQVFVHPLPKGSVTALAYAEASSLLAVSYGESQQVFDLRSKKSLYTLDSGESDIDTMLFNQAGTTLIGGYRGGDRSGSVWMFEARTGKVQRKIELNVGVILKMVLNPNERLLLVGGEKPAILDTTTGRVIRTFVGDGFVRGLAWHSSSKQFVSVTEKRQIELFDVTAAKAKSVWAGGRWLMLGASWLSNGRLLTCNADGNVTVWAKPGVPASSFVASVGRIWDVQLVPGGKGLLTFGVDGLVRWWSLEGRILRTWDLPATRLAGVSVSRDGQFFAAVSDQPKATVLVYALSVVKPVMQFRLSTAAYATAFSPDGNTLAVAGESPGVFVFDLKSRKQGASLPLGQTGFDVTFSADGQRLIASGIGFSKVWTFKDRRLERHFKDVRYRALLPDGGGFFGTKDDLDAPVRVSFITGEVTPLQSSGRQTDHIAVSPDGSKLLTLNTDNSLTVWDLDTGRLLTVGISKASEWGSELAARFLPDNNSFVLSGPGSVGLLVLRLKYSNIPDDVVDLGQQDGNVTVLEFSSDGESLLSGSSAGTNSVRLWNLGTQQSSAIADVLPPVTSAAFNADGQLCAVGNEGTVIVFSRLEQRVLKSFKTTADIAVPSLSFHPDGSLLAGSSNLSVKIWSLKTDQLEHELNGYNNGISGVAFSQDGSTLIVSPINGPLELWDVSTWSKIINIPVNGKKYGFAYNAAMNSVALGGEKGRVTVVDLNTQSVRFTQALGSGTVFSLSFSPNGVYLASSVFLEQAAIWDAVTGRVLVRFGDPEEPIAAVRWRPDGSALATGDDNGFVRLWPLKTLSLPER
jgi:WD40 repeat protein